MRLEDDSQWFGEWLAWVRNTPQELVDILSGDQTNHEEENSDFELINLCDEIQQDVFDTEDTVDSSVQC